MATKAANIEPFPHYYEDKRTLVVEAQQPKMKEAAQINPRCGQLAMDNLEVAKKWGHCDTFFVESEGNYREEYRRYQNKLRQREMDERISERTTVEFLNEHMAHLDTMDVSFAAGLANMCGLD